MDSPGISDAASPASPSAAPGPPARSDSGGEQAQVGDDGEQRQLVEDEGFKPPAEPSSVVFKEPPDPNSNSVSPESNVSTGGPGQFYGPAASFGYGSQGGTVSWPSINVRPMRPPPVPGHPGMSLAALSPVPQARQVPVVQPPYSFQTPRKRITSMQDIELFHQSEAGKTFLGFIVALSESMKGHKLSDFCKESRTLNVILKVLSVMNEWVDEIPPRQQPVRYGNPAYREWHARLDAQGPQLMLSILPVSLRAAVGEIFPYFADSFGNATRIDYGTGHEANFAAWLLCLARLGLLQPDDFQAVVSRVMVSYLNLMRKMQTTYWLEPAGSHGVWGLDDYHFLPFVFGSSQLIDHKYMKPKSIHNPDILENFSKEYLYLGCVQFVKSVKKGHLAEHSPMIDDVSGVPTWSKVNSGMLKMYKAEVLEKVPIMQHFLFGSLIPWNPPEKPDRFTGRI